MGWAGLALFAVTANADRIDRAISNSQKMGRPILALGTSEACVPCQRLKETLDGDAMKSVLSDCIVLKMDANSDEFTHFASRFPADTSIVPMVYVILPDGTQMYARGGMLEQAAIADLLHEAVRYASSMKKTNDEAVYRRILAIAKIKAQDRKLIDALKITHQLASQSGEGFELDKARAYRRQLIEAVFQWLQDLDQQMMAHDSAHGAAFRIAQIFVELADIEEIHKMSGELLIHYDKDVKTRTAVSQAKHLLKARYRQDDNLCDDAIESYQHVIKIDPTTPSARYAAKQLKVLRRKQAEKLTARLER